MFRQGLKNYFINLKYIFTPLGALFLGCVMGISVLLPNIAKAVEELVNSVVTTVGEAQVDFDALKDSLYAAVTALDWSDPVNSILTMLGSDWLTATFNDGLAAFLGDYTSRAGEIEAAINHAVETINAYVVLAVVWMFLGLFGGHLLTKFLVRRNVAKRAFWKYFLSSFLDSLFSSTILAAVAYLFAVWNTSLLISFPVTMIVVDLVALIKAYIIHGLRKVTLKQIVNGRNIGMLVLTDCTLFVISVIFAVIAFALFGGAVGLFVTLALFDVAFIVIGLNAESFVKRVALASSVSSEPKSEEPEVESETETEEPSEIISEQERENIK